MGQNVWLAAAILCTTSACATVGGTGAQSRYKRPNNISVTGCVQNNGAKSSATMDGGYMLTNTVTGNASGVRRSSPGTVSPPPAPASGTGDTATAAPNPLVPVTEFVEVSHRSASYMLNGRDSELRNYIDKKVEVTGTLEAHIDEPEDSNSMPTTGSEITHGRNTGLQWMRVASVKVVSSGCAAK